MSTFRAKQLIKDNLSIPTLPDVVLRIRSLVDDPDASLKEIGEVVAQDAPLTAKVLRIANSAYYGLRELCISAEHATAILGPRVLRNIVTQATVISEFDHLSSKDGFDVDSLWRHSILVGQTCEFAARRCKSTVGLTPEEFYVCGLLHDLGKVVMLDGLGEEYLDVYCSSVAEGRRLHAAEEETFGFNHTDVGAMVSTRWGLPTQVTCAIQFHHGPRENVQNDPVVALVANVNLLVHRIADGDEAGALKVLDEETSSFLGLTGEDVSAVVSFARESSEQVVV